MPTVAEYLEVDFDGTPAWILRADETRFVEASALRGVRLLVAPDLRLFGRDSGGRFIGPGKRPLSPAADSFHPNGILVDGRVVGAWGRRGSLVDVVLTERLTTAHYDALTAEVAGFPIRGADLSASLRFISDLTRPALFHSPQWENCS